MLVILEQIKEAAKDLYFLSESDFPLVPFHWKIQGGELAAKLISESGNPENSPVEKVSLAHFFRNMVNLDEPEIAQRFIKLQEILHEKLQGLEVYRLGTIQVKVFIVGEMPDGSYAGLSTISIET